MDISSSSSGALSPDANLTTPEPPRCPSSSANLTTPDFKLKAARDIRRLTKTSLRCRRQLSQAVGPSVSMLRFDSSESHEPALLALLNLAVKDEKERLWTMFALELEEGSKENVSGRDRGSRFPHAAIGLDLGCRLLKHSLLSFFL
ncbi:hypothetical protein K1719_013120 [Acacia pycnantha]|nr:hypothetical protein K1719_013120 [Acacia pycnantha]